MEEELRPDRRVTLWEDGQVVIALRAKRVAIDKDTPSVILYLVDVDVHYPSSMVRRPFNQDVCSWDEPCRTPDEVRFFLKGLQAGISFMNGPHLNMPAINHMTGEPSPLPEID
jgi:hypothetical protein